MASNQTGISSILVGYAVILGIVGDIVRVQGSEAKSGNGATPCLEDLAVVEAVGGGLSLAQDIGIKRDVVALLVFRGTRANSTDSAARCLVHRIQAGYAHIILG